MLLAVAMLIMDQRKYDDDVPIRRSSKDVFECLVSRGIFYNKYDAHLTSQKFYDVV